MVNRALYFVMQQGLTIRGWEYDWQKKESLCSEQPQFRCHSIWWNDFVQKTIWNELGSASLAWVQKYFYKELRLTDLINFNFWSNFDKSYEMVGYIVIKNCEFIVNCDNLVKLHQFVAFPIVYNVCNL
jgi:hypothetical protein